MPSNLDRNPSMVQYYNSFVGLSNNTVVFVNQQILLIPLIPIFDFIIGIARKCTSCLAQN